MSESEREMESSGQIADNNILVVRKNYCQWRSSAQHSWVRNQNKNRKCEQKTRDRASKRTTTKLIRMCKCRARMSKSNIEVCCVCFIFLLLILRLRLFSSFLSCKRYKRSNQNTIHTLHNKQHSLIHVLNIYTKHIVTYTHNTTFINNSFFLLFTHTHIFFVFFCFWYVILVRLLPLLLLLLLLVVSVLYCFLLINKCSARTFSNVCICVCVHGSFIFMYKVWTHMWWL